MFGFHSQICTLFSEDEAKNIKGNTHQRILLRWKSLEAQM